MRNSKPETDQLEEFTAAVVTHDDAPDECTIYPEDVPEHSRQCTWITAKEGSFCAAVERR